MRFAQTYGIEEAVVIDNLYYWIAKNAANGIHKHDGRYWTYNSAKAFARLFPYMGETKIYRVLVNLEKVGFIAKGNFSEDKHDRTNWYAFTDSGIAELKEEKYNIEKFSDTLQNDGMDFAKMQNGDCKNAECNINNYTDKKQQIEKEEKEDIKISSKKSGCNVFVSDEDVFIDSIYAMYPSKCPVRGTSLSKTHADKKRIKALMRTYTREQIRAVVEREVSNKLGKYSMKNFSTFLNNFPDPNEMCDNSTPKSINNNLPVGFILESDRDRIISESKKDLWK